MTALIRIQNVVCHIEGTFPQKALDNALSFHVQGYLFSPLYRKCKKCDQFINRNTGKCPQCHRPRAWDGKKHLLQGGRNLYFPTGCLPVAVRLLTALGVEIVYQDERQKPEQPDPEEAFKIVLSDGSLESLWKEQREALCAGLKYGRGVIQMPTGSGKSRVLAGFCKLLPYPVIILINNQSIAKQLQNEISEHIEEPVGMIKGGVFAPERVTIAMTQSLYNGVEANDPDTLELIKSTRVLMLDECHHTSSNTWYSLCKAFVNAYFRFGVTGTANMRPAGDDLLLIGATGGILYEASEAELIKQGKLALPIIHFYRIDSEDDNNILEQSNNKKKKKDKEPYQQAYQRHVSNNINLNKLCAQIIKNLHNSAQILVLFEYKEHINNVVALISDVEHTVLTGEEDVEYREEIKELFVEGTVKVIMATKIFDEGVSINNIDVVIRMGLMQTPIKTKQQVGRGQRVKRKGKPNVVHIVDFLHTSQADLVKHSLAHYEFYEKMSYPIIIETEPLSSLNCPKEVANAITSCNMDRG